jgi:VWFA-related protein
VLRDGTIADDQRVMNAEGMVETAGVHLVEVPVIVESRRALLPQEVIVREEGTERPVERIVGPDEAPLILGVVIDSSSSMRPTILELQEAAVQFVESVMGPRDRAFVLAFNTDARLIQAPTQDAEAVKAAIMSIRPEGLTALHDAFILGLMQFQTTGSRRAMVVFSDGVNRSSRYTMEEVNETARRAGVPVYVIGMTPPELRGLSHAPVFTAAASGRARSYEFEGAVEELTNLAWTTGGSFEEIWSIENVGRIYEDIASELGRQSLVIYRSGTQAKGAWRAIDVRTRGRGKLRAPGGVYVRVD